MGRLYGFIFQLVIFTIVFFLATIHVSAQEFPVAIGSDTTYTGGAVYGGHNGIIAICGDSSSPYAMTAQLVAYPGTLVGSRIHLGAYGVPMGAQPLFDGSRYFLIWRSVSGELQGQFIDTTGALVGSVLTIAANVLLEIKYTPATVLGDTIYLATFVKSDGYLYGQRIGKSGELLGSAFQVSNGIKAREASIAFDGTNFLCVWVSKDDNTTIHGQFVNKEGALSGSVFTIDGDSKASDNPTSLAFDGTRYLLAYHNAERVTDSWNMWRLVGQFITTAGAVADSFTICDTTQNPGYPSVAFDGTHYFITWLQKSNTLMGRFYTTAGVGIDTPFVVMEPTGKKFPMGGVGFGGGHYLVVAAKLDSSFSDGDIYACFISPLSATGITANTDIVPKEIMLCQNYPNPFNPSTVIRYQLSAAGLVSLKVFDLLGRDVAVLVNGIKSAGTYNVIFNASKLSSGVYFYQLHAGTSSSIKKLILVK